MNPALAHRLASFACTLSYDRLDKAVVHEVKRRVVDSLGCALGAWSEAPCAIARQVASTMTATPGATLWGTTHKAPLDWAALANGIGVRYFDYNDTYLSKEPAHPSDNIPAAIAVAEAESAPGRELIAAIVIAYEIQCRFCDAASLRVRGWDHVTYGAFSTAMAAARLMRLDAERARHACGIAGVASAALRQSRVGELSHWKGCAFANAARHGVYAAMLARAGMTGPAPIFEGQMGFEKLVSGPLDLAGPFPADPARRDAGEFMILRTCIKFWPAEYHSQSAIGAALHLRPQVPSIDAIESIVIASHDAAVDIIGSEPEKWDPHSRETADHSLPYITGAALMDGTITDAQFAPARYRDRALLDLVAKVRVERDADLSAIYPEAVGNRVTITLRDGKMLSHRIDYPRGHAKNPMTDAEVESKFRALAEPVVGSARAGEILERCWRLDEAANVTPLVRLLEM